MDEQSYNLGEQSIEPDQFQILEEKVESLIVLITDTKNEKAILAEKVQEQEVTIAELSDQIETLKMTQENAKQRIISLLERIDQIHL